MSKRIAIIGAGPGGYVAAIRFAQLGAEVVLIEKKAIGGTCLNIGCIPTKALYRSAEIYSNIKKADSFGIEVGSVSLDPQKIYHRKAQITNTLVTGIEQLLQANKIQVIKGTASFAGEKTLKIQTPDGEREDRFDAIIIATGSKSDIPDYPGMDLPGIITSDDLLNMVEIPKSMVILGVGVIALEFACIYNAFGTKVQVVARGNRILKHEDLEMTKRLLPMLKKQGIEVLLETQIQKVEKAGDGLLVHATGKKGPLTLESKYVLASLGRSPYAEGLDLENAGIAYSAKGIQVNEYLETTAPGVFAIGDVNGISLLAHAASHHGVSVADYVMLGAKVRLGIVPSCTFTFPELSSVGATEEKLKEAGVEYKSSKFLFGANGKALSLGEGEGLVKVLSDMQNNILGVHVLGPHASDLIHEGVLSLGAHLKADQIKDMIHAHPTLAESFYEAVLGLNNEAIHMVPAKKK